MTKTQALELVALLSFKDRLESFAHRMRWRAVGKRCADQWIQPRWYTMVNPRAMDYSRRASELSEQLPC